MVKRLFVEKKQGFDIEAQNLFKEIKEKLKVGIDRLRTLDRYDIEGVPEARFEEIKNLVFYEDGVDAISEDQIDYPENAFVFGVQDLPGQYDQRADSAEIAIRLALPDTNPVCRRARFYVIEGNLKESDKETILKYLINPTDTKQASPEKPETLTEETPEPPDVARCEGFCDMDLPSLSVFVDEMGFAMNEDDLLCVQLYFRDEERRDPTVTELRAIDTYWSDHCRHTTFLTHLKDIDFEEGRYSALVKAAYSEYLGLREEVFGDSVQARPVTMMDMATIGAKYLKKKGLLEDLDESEEVNACSIKIKAEITGETGEEPVLEDWLFMFKNETHNHPTEIEPFGGAGTCLGGGIRDPLSGRAHVHQAMRITGSGDPRVSIEETLSGKLPQYYITRTAAKGYSSYGNQVGGASGFIEEIYDEGYVAKRMELGALVAAAPAENVVREVPAVGDAILILGGKTGRDGVGAATGSSKEQTNESINTAGAEVQKGNPAIETGVIRLFRRREASRLIKRCNDFGAGGVSVAIGELAPSIDVDLDKVPAKYRGLDGTELAVSESQERMAVVISEKNLEEFCGYASEENLEATKVAEVTDTGRFRMYWRGKLIFDLSRKFLDTNGAVQIRNAKILEKNIQPWREPRDNRDGPFCPPAQQSIDKESLLGLLSDLNCAGKRGLIEYFDSTIGAGTLLMPLGGKAQLTPALGMAAKLPVLSGDTNTATLMAYGFDPLIAKNSTFHSALYAVLDSCTKICAMGGDPEKIRLSFQEFFPRLGNDAERWASPVMALLGALKAQKALNVPSIGGKDSMSGSFHDLDIVPTLAAFAVCTADARKIISPEFKKAGSSLVFIECARDDLLMPDFEAFKKNMNTIHELAEKGKILSASTVPYGGLFVAVSKMAMGNGIGAKLFAEYSALLKDESYGSILVEIDGGESLDVLLNGLPYHVVGETTESGSVEVNSGLSQTGSVVIPLEEIIRCWEEPLKGVFPVEADADFPASVIAGSAQLTTGSFAQRTARSISDEAGNKAAKQSSTRSGISRPKVTIPVFPGTLGETDCRRAFERAGAEVTLVNILSLNPDDETRSVKHAADEIKRSHIVVLPGGASYGDDPGGSSKLIMAIMKNPYMTEAFSELLENKGGLVLGIGSGFKALLKLGLLPYGRFTEPEQDAPFITRNTLSRNVSKIVRVRVSSLLSPWFAAADIGDIHSLPLSISEGRFSVSDEALTKMMSKGQIATQFVDMSGEPTYDIRFNPVGSNYAIEAITSPDGRVLGRIGNAERNAPGLYLNVPGNYDESIFASGVAYFK